MANELNVNVKKIKNMDMATKGKEKNTRRKKFLVTTLLVVSLLAIGLVGSLGYNAFAKKDVRQAVFLTNGQVYFGYLSRSNSPIIQLTDTYYLKSAKELQGSDKSKIVIVRLGGELHGPEGTMQINRDQVLFFEDMRDDSKVNQAIEKAKSSNTPVSR